MSIENHNAEGEGDRDLLLLERAQALRAIDDLIAAVHQGSGGGTVVLGGAGMGKTALLARAVTAAGRADLRVLDARGGEFERGLPFGVARQLLAGVVRSLAADERRRVLTGAAAQAQGAIGLTSPIAGHDPIGVVDGLYWLAANLAESGPLMLMIDDLHWVDTPTARWLSYLAPRIRDLPIGVIAAARPSQADSVELDDLMAGRHMTTVVLEPLGAAAVSELVRIQFGKDGTTRFVEACHTAVGGNPFYLGELLRAAVADGIAPNDEQANRVPHLGHREVGRSILVRMARLGEGARRLATAVAVLGVNAELRHAAQLSDLSLDEALVAWDVLTNAEILRGEQPLEFVHPIVRAAVHDEIPRGERSRAHRRAAEMLAADGAPADQVALHALACEPFGDQQIVDWLRQAAREAVAAGAPDAGARYLERALQEPPDPAVRGVVHFEIGQALLGLDTAAAAEAFRTAAADGSNDWVLNAQRWRGYSLAYSGRIREALSSFDDAITLAGDDVEIARHLEGTRDFYAAWWADDPDRCARARGLQERADTVDGRSASERRILATAALSVTITGRDTAEVARGYVNQASRAGLTWLDPQDGSETASAVGNTLTICGEQQASDLYTEWLEEVRSRGWVVNLAGGYFQRALVRYRCGELIEAEGDARTSWNLVSPAGQSAATIYWWSAATLAQILIARGELGEAAELMSSTGLGDEPLEVVMYPWPAVLKGELALARGSLDEAGDILLAAGAWLEERGFRNPAYIPWRALAAPVLVATGRMQKAKEVIEPGLRRARAFGAPWALGMNLRAAGVTEQGARGIELLREAVAVLASSSCRNEHAHALLELGAMLRRSNQRASAREYLKQALDMSHRCGAVPLAARAHRELLATGARPRRPMLSGVDSLTASELRTARLAAGGLSNPEIAQQLFVTRKTVETHLSRVYLKLDITSRDQLPSHLV